MDTLGDLASLRLAFELDQDEWTLLKQEDTDTASLSSLQTLSQDLSEGMQDQDSESEEKPLCSALAEFERRAAADEQLELAVKQVR